MSIRIQLDRLSPPASSSGRSSLIGWDLLQLTDAVAAPWRLQFKFEGASWNGRVPTWLPLANELPVFFSDDIGDIITSKVALCAELERGPEYLIASIDILSKRMQSCSVCRAYHVDTANPLVWRMPQSDCFQKCCHNTHTAAESKLLFKNVVQVMSKKPRHERGILESLNHTLPKEGAIVFGANSPHVPEFFRAPPQMEASNKSKDSSGKPRKCSFWFLKALFGGSSPLGEIKSYDWHIYQL